MQIEMAKRELRKRIHAGHAHDLLGEKFAAAENYSLGELRCPWARVVRPHWLNPAGTSFRSRLPDRVRGKTSHEGFLGSCFGRLWGHRPSLPRSKFFEKSEKKPCQAPHASVFLTPKPNQTNGETNDKTRA